MAMKRSQIGRFLIPAICLAAAIAPTALGQKNGSDPQFKIRLDFNRWHDCDEIKSDLLRLEKAFPKFLKYSSLGKSFEGRDMMLMTINNPDTGPELSKPAMYIEANVHGNEIQGGEICLYTIWYLMENYGRMEPITRLVNERVFYIVPTVNPDGRQHFLQVGSGGRSGSIPLDNDNDRLKKEDDVEDLNGDGVIEQMIKYVGQGQGTHRKNPSFPRILEPAPAGTRGDYVLLGSEGVDNDGDGLINEDAPGGYDPNRNFGADWQPNYIQGGSMEYPFQLPEARSINEFLTAHPNIAGVQSYHNNGGMILRGPGAEWSGEYPRSDVQVYDELGRNGERILPYYRYIVIWSGLYTVHGGFTDWTNDGYGILSFSNELWNEGQYFNSPELQAQQKNPDSPINPRIANYFFNDYLEFGDEYMDWKEFEHPQFGKVELGGWKKTWGRIPPRFMSEEMCHRNMAFSLYQADQMPQMAMGNASVDALSQGTYRVRIEVENKKLIPTIMARAADSGVVTPDLLTVEGKDLKVLTVGLVRDKIRPFGTQLIDQQDLKRIMIRNGHPGRTVRTFEYIVSGSGDMTVSYVSAKGGAAKKTVSLKSQP